MASPHCHTIVGLPKSLQPPQAFTGRALLPQDIQIPVIRADLEKRILRAIPPVEHFLHLVRVLTQPKANRPLICFVARITLHSYLHPSFMVRAVSKKRHSCILCRAVFCVETTPFHEKVFPGDYGSIWPPGRRSLRH